MLPPGGLSGSGMIGIADQSCRWLGPLIIAPAIDPGEPSRPGPTRQGRSSSGALHLDPWGQAYSPGGPVADHVLYGQVLDHDHVVAADQGRGGAVQEIGTGRADFPVRAGDLRPGLGAVRGTALAAGQPPLVA